jgi:ketosteroid isomerase-like protein
VLFFVTRLPWSRALKKLPFRLPGKLSKAQGEGDEMKPRFVIAMALVLALAVPASMLAQGSKAERQVRAVLGKIQQAQKGGPEAATTLDKYLADDYTLILPNGAVLTKAENVEGFRSGKSAYQKFDFSDVKVRVYGNTALVTGIVKGAGEMAGQKYTGNRRSRFTRVLVKQNGIWRLVLTQNTRIAEPDKQ